MLLIRPLHPVPLLPAQRYSFIPFKWFSIPKYENPSTLSLLESVNIYSHAFGLGLFLVMITALLFHHNHLLHFIHQGIFTIFYTSTTFTSTSLSHPTTTVWDWFAITIFMAGAACCLSCSALFHTFCCHSLKACVAWNKIDYVGIVVLIL